MTDHSNPVCPECGEVGTIEANTWEAWCYDCDLHVTEQDQPEEFKKLRAMVLARREEVGRFFDEMLKRGNR